MNSVKQVYHHESQKEPTTKGFLANQKVALQEPYPNQQMQMQQQNFMQQQQMQVQMQMQNNQVQIKKEDRKKNSKQPRPELFEQNEKNLDF